MTESRPASDTAKREALKQGRPVSTSALWVTPVVNVLAMSPASAQTWSGATSAENHR